MQTLAEPSMNSTACICCREVKPSRSIISPVSCLKWHLFYREQLPFLYGLTQILIDIQPLVKIRHCLEGKKGKYEIGSDLPNIMSRITKSTIVGGKSCIFTKKFNITHCNSKRDLGNCCVKCMRRVESPETTHRATPRPCPVVCRDSLL